MIDLHCHYLPGVDDGARTLADALALASASVADGITTAVLTPHVHPGVFDNRLSALRPAFEVFRRALAEARIPLEVHLGAEVRVHPTAFELLAIDELPFIGHFGEDRLVLLEFPDGQLPVGGLAAVRFLANQGVRALIAHPERNKEVMRDPERIKPYLDAGCLLQVTAASITGRFGAPAFRTARHLLEKGWVDIVASDAHNLSARPPVMQEARAELIRHFGLGVAHRLTEERPGELVARRRAAVEASGVA